jgi:PAS domain S-box-containing protein
MTDYNVHSTLFFKYLRVTRHILLLLAAVIFTHILLLIFFPGNRREVTDIVWVFSEFLKLTLSVIAWRKARDFVKRAWLFIIIYGLLILSGIMIRSYYDIFLHIYSGIVIVPYLFASGNIAVVIAFILFSHSRETSFKIIRQINLLGLILVTMLAVSYLINYNTLPESAGIESIVRAAIAWVVNLSAFIIGVGVYWTGVWKRSVKRRTVFNILLFSTFISFILNNLYYTKKILAGTGFTGGFPDLLGTAAILLICLAAWHEIKFKEQYDEKADYNLFYVSRIERIIPAITLVTMLAVIYFNSSKLDSQLIRNLVFFMIPYIVFLVFFELYSYRSEDAILSVLSLSPIGVHITDRRFTKTYFINKSLFDILRSMEIPPDLVTGSNISDDLKQNIIISIAKNITMDHVETALLRPDGTKLNAQCKIIPARYYSYDIVITWIWDITDRKKYEGAILQQKYSAEIASLYKSELLNNLSNRMQSGYVTMKIDNDGWPDLIFTGMNKRILEIFDFKSDLSGRSFKEIFPDPNPEFIAQLIEVLNSGVSIKRELTVKRANKVFTVLIFKASDDEVACLIDDITENKRKERELINRERELSNLLKNLPGMVYRCRNDKEWTMFFVSQGSFDLTGYKPEELMDGGAVSWNGLVHPDDREKVWIEGQVAISRRESYYLDYRIIAKDSSVKYVFEKGLGVYDENGELLFLEGFIFDITKQKEAESILRENEIKEKEIEKARALGQMAGGIAHDLNNRLMGIGSYTSLIDLKIQDPGIKKYTDGIQESIRKSTELIENLLIFARQSDLITDIFSIHNMLREMALKVQNEFSGVIMVNSIFSAENDKVRGDYKQIYKAVLNMVSNAKDAMPEGGVITVSTENKTIDNSNLLDLAEGDTKKVFVVIKISDTGMGIEKDNLSRIFDPFYTTKPVGSGKGLSLSAVYGTIQAHKGAITVDSVPGKGTSFSIYLPVV